MDRRFRFNRAYDPRCNRIYRIQTEAPGDIADITHKILLPVQGYGGLTLELQQPGGIKAVTLPNVAHVPALGCNFLFTRRASERSGEPFINYPTNA